MQPKAIVALVFLAIALVACAGSGTASAPSATPGPALAQAELKYRLIDRFGPRWFCDPDFYPVARANEVDLALQRFPELRADPKTFATILAHLGLADGPNFTDQQKLTVYREWKQLNATILDPIGNGNYRFDYLAMPAAAGSSEGMRTAGTIDQQGTISVEQQAPAGQPPCPICLARGTRIAGIDGDVAIEDMRVGMPVWSVDEAGRPFAAVVLRVGRVAVGPWHQVVRLVLDDGRSVRASPDHRLADGRPLGTIRAGDMVNGTRVARATLEPYGDGQTFDLLPSGPTSAYWADGILLRSTLGGPLTGR
jgi:hypothetical protein